MIALVAYSSGLARYRRFVRTVVALTIVAAVAWGLTPWYGLTFNMSTSLPGTLYFIRKGPCRPRLGDTIAFRWHGGGDLPRRTDLHQTRGWSAWRCRARDWPECLGQ